jgi:hypothetical protein
MPAKYGAEKVVGGSILMSANGIEERIDCVVNLNIFLQSSTSKLEANLALRIMFGVRVLLD